MKDYKKVIIFYPMTDKLACGITFANLFKGWPAEKLAVIADGTDETFVENAEVIRELFELSDYHCWFKKEKESYSIHSTSKVLPDIDFHLEIIKVNELPYVEVEVTDSTVDADKVKKAISDYMILLSLDPNKKDTRSWVEIVESQNKYVQ